MEDAENNLQPSKKRVAGVQLSRDNPGLDDDEDTSEQEAGTFKRASDEVLATRRIVKIRRPQSASTPSAVAPAASNPFAAIRLVAPAAPASPEAVEVNSTISNEVEQIDNNNKTSENEVDDAKDQSAVDEVKPVTDDGNAERIDSKVDELKAENDVEHSNAVCEKEETKPTSEEGAEDGGSQEVATKATETDKSEIGDGKVVEGGGNSEEKDNGKETMERNENDNVEETTEKSSEASSFSSFQQLSSSQNAFSGLVGTGFSSTTFSFGSINKDGSSTTGSLFGVKNDQPSLGFGASGNGNSPIFGAVGAASKADSSKFPAMQEVTVETGEENEKAVFTADSVLFEFIDGAWKERGKGELKVNIPTVSAGKARLVMRTRGNYRLILNASLFPDMKLTNMDKKGITFACANSAAEGKDGLSTVALKFKDASLVEEFRAAVMEHKSTAPVTLKTPENSPKASDE